jgi:phage shock protein A
MGDGISLERRAAQARRDYWQRVHESALSAGDKEAAANALRFVQEYDSLLAMIERKLQPPK